MEHGILNGLRIKVVGDIGRKGRKSREPVDEVDLALGSRALSAYMRQHTCNKAITVIRHFTIDIQGAYRWSVFRISDQLTLNL